jgi:hypothetical protein
MLLSSTGQQLYTTTQRSKKMETAKRNATCTLQLCRNKPKTIENKFTVVLTQAIDDGFASISNLDKEVIYLNLENTFKIKKQDIPFKIEGFTDAIEQMFGVGAKLIEIRIIETLHKRIPEFTFFAQKASIGFNEYLVSLRAFLRQTL